MSKELDWKKIETEYITTDISQRALAKKYKVSYGTLRGRAEREGWYSAKEEYNRKVIANTTQKLEKLQIKNLVKEVEAADCGAEIVLKFLNAQKDNNKGDYINVKELNEALSALAKCATIKKVALELSKLGENSSSIEVTFTDDIKEFAV